MKTNWFESRVRYKNAEGQEVIETYLIDAMSFTEAENLVIEEVAHYGFNEFDVETVHKHNYREVFRSDKEKFYKAKVAFITIDEKTGVEKNKCVNMLIQEESLNKAIDRLFEEMKDTMSDWELLQVAKTPIVDIISCVKEQETKSETAE